jgi:hypothetical protein
MEVVGEVNFWSHVGVRGASVSSPGRQGENAGVRPLPYIHCGLRK